MIDLHSHILFNIDDGSSTLEESLELLDMAYQNGFRGITCTSHYEEGKYENINYYKNFQVFKDSAKKRYRDMEIYQGNELYLSTSTVETINSGSAYTLNGGIYYLLELPVEIPGTVAILAIGKILTHCKVVLAHVERYREFTLNDYKTLKKMGVVFQCNFGSLEGGHRSRVLKLLQLHMVDILASDSHRVAWRNYNISKYISEIKEELEKEKDLKKGNYSVEEYFKILTEINPKNVLNSKEIVDVKKIVNTKDKSENGEKKNEKKSFFNGVTSKFSGLFTRTKSK